MKSILWLMIILLLVGCGGGGGGASQSSSDTANDEETVEIDAISEIEKYLVRIEFDEPPSWDILESLSKEVKRDKLPKMMVRVHGDSYKISETVGYVGESMEQWDRLEETYHNNVVSIAANAFPPVVTMEGESFDYPLDTDIYDKKMRNAVVGYLKYKLQNKIVLWVNYYPPIDKTNRAYPFDTFETESAFRDYVSNKLVPNLRIEAKAAELVKAELFAPFLTELGTLIEGQIFVKDENWTGIQKAQLAQFYVTSVIDATRDIYHGKIIAYDYYNNDLWGNPNPYRDINYSGYDMLGITFISKCNESENRNYYKRRLEDVLYTSQKNSIPWYGGEIWVPDSSIKVCQDRGEKIEEFEPKIYSSIIDELTNARVKPLGLFIDDDFRTNEAKDVVKAFFLENY